MRDIRPNILGITEKESCSNISGSADVVVDYLNNKPNNMITSLVEIRVAPDWGGMFDVGYFSRQSFEQPQTAIGVKTQ